MSEVTSRKLQAGTTVFINGAEAHLLQDANVETTNANWAVIDSVSLDRDKRDSDGRREARSVAGRPGSASLSGASNNLNPAPTVGPCNDGHVNDHEDGHSDGRVNDHKDGRMDGRVNDRQDGRMDGRANFPTPGAPSVSTPGAPVAPIPGVQREPAPGSKPSVIVPAASQARTDADRKAEAKPDAFKK